MQRDEIMARTKRVGGMVMEEEGGDREGEKGENVLRNGKMHPSMPALSFCDL